MRGFGSVDANMPVNKGARPGQRFTFEELVQCP